MCGSNLLDGALLVLLLLLLIEDLCNNSSLICFWIWKKKKHLEIAKGSPQNQLSHLVFFKTVFYLVFSPLYFVNFIFNVVKVSYLIKMLIFLLMYFQYSVFCTFYILYNIYLVLSVICLLFNISVLYFVF